MARSSRGRGRKSSKRMVDWVVNDETYGSAITLPNGSQVALALTMPAFMMQGLYPIIGTDNPGYQLPEQDSGQVAYAVRGQMSLNPTIWAAGSILRVMMRIVKKPVEYGSAMQAIIDPQYTLFGAPYANERFVWQHYVRESFTFGAFNAETFRINWKGVQKIEPDEALWLIVENQSGITNEVILNPFVRTLMRAN